MSEKINGILYEALFKDKNKKKSLFGTMKKTDISDLNLRDHEDRYKCYRNVKILTGAGDPHFANFSDSIMLILQINWIF